MRLGLRLVKGLKEASSVQRVVAARAEAPFDSAEDLARRAELEQHEMRLLARADAREAANGGFAARLLAVHGTCRRFS